MGKRHLWLVGALAAMLLGAFGIVAVAFVEARSDPRVRRLDLPVVAWPVGAPPLRVALLSDIHIGDGAMDSARLARIADQVNAERPDLVLIAGDMVFGHDAANGARYAAGLRVPLARLRAPLGVVAVPGNHDHWTALAAIRSALEGAGITVLANQAARRGPLTILGLDDGFSGHADVAATLRAARGLGGVPVLLTHSPDTAATLPPGTAPLMLVGHTHCGQVVLPLIGAPGNWGLLHGRRIYDPRYRCGAVRVAAGTLLVTAGLGTSGVPLRLGAPPDWWLVTLGPVR